MSQVSAILHSSYPALLSQPLPTASPSQPNTLARLPELTLSKLRKAALFPDLDSGSYPTTPNPNQIAGPSKSHEVAEGATSLATAATGSAVMTGGHSSGQPKEEKQPKKRGRKRLKDPDELEADEDFDEPAKPRRNRKGSPDTNAKRKVQNRAAQRAFRERKEKHVKDLEEKVVAQDEQLVTFRNIVEQLLFENQALRRGEDIAERQWELPPLLPDLDAPSPSRQSPGSVHDQDHDQERDRDAEFDLKDEVDPPAATAAVTLMEFPIGNPLAPNATLSMPDSSERSDQAPIDYTNPSFDGDFKFDFDAPIDFSNSVPLPPLFQDLFSESYTLPTNDNAYDAPTNPGPTTGELADPDEDADMCPLDDDVEEAPALPNGRLPCDKPECDFSVISCALPIPWRPAAIDEKDVSSKNVWVCTQAWGKLCSHPLFSLCDVDELCHELRDKTRCSDDGRLVITKSAVCDVFRSIPARARARRLQMEMAGKQ